VRKEQNEIKQSLCAARRDFHLSRCTQAASNKIIEVREGNNYSILYVTAHLVLQSCRRRQVKICPKAGAETSAARI